MKIHTILTLLIILIFASFCKNNYKEQHLVNYYAHIDSNQSKKGLLRKLVKNTQILKLPYMDTYQVRDSIYHLYDNYNHEDFMIFDQTSPVIIGILPDTTNYFYFLRYYSGDYYCPIITTISKEGEQLSEVPISSMLCVFSECDSCSETFIIDKNMRFELEAKALLKSNGKFITKEHEYQLGYIKGKDIYTRDSIVVK